MPRLSNPLIYGYTWLFTLRYVRSYHTILFITLLVDAIHVVPGIPSRYYSTAYIPYWCCRCDEFCSFPTVTAFTVPRSLGGMIVPYTTYDYTLLIWWVRSITVQPGPVHFVVPHSLGPICSRWWAFVVHVDRYVTFPVVTGVYRLPGCWYI